MKTVKIIGLVLAIAVMFIARPAFADYTLDLKNSGGTVIKTYTITTNQVAHIQKAADNKGITILKHFEGALNSLVESSTVSNKINWIRNNNTFVEEQSRQP